MFSKKPGSPLPHSSQGKSMANSTFSVFGPDIKIKGNVAASADLHIDGHVEGDVSCTALVQGESGEIVGGVTAETARLSGTVRGTINVRELVVLKSARIHDRPVNPRPFLEAVPHVLEKTGQPAAPKSAR